MKMDSNGKPADMTNVLDLNIGRQVVITKGDYAMSTGVVVG